jgi:DNA topoisomerase-1
MPKPLVIVESPSKARTISRFLGDDYVVESSIGHIRDLPRGASDVPAAYKGEAWARLGVDVDNGFKPLYVVSPGKKDQVAKLKSLVRGASEVYLATDEDREGESIAWHLLEVLNPQVPVRRMVFHEITRAAIQRAVEEWRDLDRRLVDAQETRRILDRLYGYEVSPVLWRKVAPNLSAGRVQSVATRLVVERERARMRFHVASFWDIAGRFAKTAGEGDDAGEFGATLVGVAGRRVATGRDFDERGGLTRNDVVLLDEARARGLAADLGDADFAVRTVEERPWRRSPYPPFMTSTLQQEAGRKLRFSSAKTMSVAQSLYESGYITYMRTDSTTLSDQALQAARNQARQLYGDQYVPAQPRRYDKKVKNAQEAHEAIRPAGETFATPQETRLSGDERRLYELVWMRTVASQMADAVGQGVQVRLGATTSAGEDTEWATSGRVITFPGFLRAYVEGSDDPDAELEDREVRLPRLVVGDTLDLRSLSPEGHATQPPARYTEASLVKALEELGVGRPSTYSSIIDTILNRGYVWKKGSALVPTWTAFAVTGLLEQHFAKLVDYGFTAGMEEDLDEIARGDEESVPWLTRFYFGDGGPDQAQPVAGDGGDDGLKRMVHDRLDQIDALEVNSIPIGDGTSDIVVRVGRYGPYLQAGDRRVSVPEDLTPDELSVARANELLEAPPATDRELGADPETSLPVLVRNGRFGTYVQLGRAEDVEGKPRTASLLRTMTPESVTLDDALRLLTLPRTVGVDPTNNEPIVAENGRYGPYLRRGGTDSRETRSLDSEEQLFTVTLDEAVALFAQPKTRRGQTSAAPLAEFGTDPVSGGVITLKEGRFGPYVTDGATNASLRKGDTLATMTNERAAELLAARRARVAEEGPSRGRKSAGRSASATKAAPKKTATKAGAAKKTAAKKATGATKATAKKATGATKATAKKATAGSTAKKVAGAKKASASGPVES